MFPENSHLLITTPRHVFAWDRSGIRPIFRSKAGGIVAAREAKDGSGVLAVASSNVVVMHDARRRKDESWGLNAPREEVRHLEYSPDATSLFLSTTSGGAIQHYSTEKQRLLDPAQTHHAAPVALAISPTGHLMLSASQDPPMVFLKNLAHNTSPLKIQPQASDAAVCCAVFHPERPNVFLLAFRDGTVAAYDATKMPRNNRGTYANQQSVNDGEIAHLQKVHRATAADADAAPIAGITFLPGYKTRAITAGRDGRCKLIDFTKGGETLRTWHAKAPLTSIAVWGLRAKAEPGSLREVASEHRRNRSSSSHTIGGPTSTSSIIAVSRLDGKVQLYDSVGLLLAQRAVSSLEEQILSLEWAKGAAPESHVTDALGRHFSDAESIPPIPITKQRVVSSPPTIAAQKEAHKEIVPARTGLGLPAELRTRPPSRQFTIHPDEEAQGTVQYTPSPKRQPTGSAQVVNYQDLFSPVKVSNPAEQSPAKRLVSNSPRTRPCISSQTFVKSPAVLLSSSAAVSPGQATSKSPSTHFTSAASECVPHKSDKVSSLKPKHRVSSQASPLSRAKRRITFQQSGDGSTRSINSGSPKLINSNAKVLADLRRLNKDDLTNQRYGTLSSYAAVQRTGSANDSQRSKASSIRPPPRARSNKPRSPPSIHVHDPSTWPSDSNADSHSTDIWFTSGSEDDTSHKRRRRMKPLTRPPARQTSRSRITSKGTISTGLPTDPSQALPAHDGWTDGDGDRYLTAQSRLSPVASLSLISEDLRNLFPRTSSLSPNKQTRTARTGQTRAPVGKDGTLTERAVNAVATGRPPCSPWDKVKASKSMQPSPSRKHDAVKFYEGPCTMSGALPQRELVVCSTCPETNSRLKDLEGQVAQLRGEVLAMKAVLRRDGVPLPACLR